MNTCRLCKKAEYQTPEENLIKYSVRHYVHLSCALTKWGNTFLDGLHDHQIGQLPFMVLDQFDGALEHAQQLLKKGSQS